MSTLSVSTFALSVSTFAQQEMPNDLKKIKKLFFWQCFSKNNQKGPKSQIQRHELYLPGKGFVILKYSEILYIDHRY